MSTCTKELMDNFLARRCFKKTLCLKSSVSGGKCKYSCSFGSRNPQAFKSQNVRKTKKIFDLLGCSHSFFKIWSLHQPFGNMSIDSYGSVWFIDHCLSSASFRVLDKKEKMFQLG